MREWLLGNHGPQIWRINQAS